MALIYIVEDDTNILEIEEIALKNSGYEEEGFVNAKDFFDRIVQKKPDLVLLDIMLPDISGVELLQEIREKNRDVKIIMITAYETIKSVIEIMNIPISGYITKPFVVKEVRERIRDIL